MKVPCQGCGVETEESEISAYDVQPSDDKDDNWRFCKVCLSCFDKLGGDLWTGEWVWETLGSKIPFSQLPLLSTKEKE